MKIYLAGPMRFREDRNKPEFDRIAHILRTGGHEVFNPAIYVATQDDTTVEGCREIFAADAAWLCKYADVVMLLPGWEISKGAKAEAALAIAIGIEIMEWKHVSLSTMRRADRSDRDASRAADEAVQELWDQVSDGRN